MVRVAGPLIWCRSIYNSNRERCFRVYRLPERIMNQYPGLSIFKVPLVALACGFLALGAVVVQAAKASLSQEQLNKQASHIIVGHVVTVTSKKQKSRVERAVGIHRDHVFTIKLKVKTISKGSGVKVDDEILIEAWKPAIRIPPIPGLQGHESIPQKGGLVTIYVKARKGKPYEPLLPNGIVIKNKVKKIK